jgi:transposase
VFSNNLVIFAPKVGSFHNAMFISIRKKSSNMNAAGWASVVDVSRTFNCSCNTIHELVRRYRLTGDVHDRPRPGRPRATTQTNDRAVVLSHLRDRFRPATLTAPAFNVTAQPIRNRLRAQQRPIRTQIHIQAVFSLYAIVRPVLGGHVRTVTGADVTGILSCFQTSLVTISVMQTAV